MGGQLTIDRLSAGLKTLCRGMKSAFILMSLTTVSIGSKYEVNNVASQLVTDEKLLVIGLHWF